MNILLRVIPVLFVFSLINQKAHSQTLYSNDNSHGIMAFSGYSNLHGPASSVMAGVAYSVNRDLDLTFEYSVVNHGISTGYWSSQPMRTRLYTGSVSIYPFKEWEGKPLTGQVSVAAGWGVDDFNEGPVLNVSAAFSTKENLSDEFDIIPRFMLSYVPFVGQQLVQTVSIGFDVGLLYKVSPGTSLLINPLLIVDIDEQNSSSGIVVGIVI